MEKKRVVAEDVNRLHDVSMPHISPDGRRVVFVRSTVMEVPKEEGKKKEQANKSHLWMWDRETGETRPLTVVRENALMPRWSPDGRWIAFLSNREEEKEMHLYVMPADGGEARRVTQDPIVRVTDFDWSPDGEWLVFTAKARSEDEPPPEDRLWREVTRLIWKMDGEGWWDGRWVQVWKVRRDGEEQQRLVDAPVDHGFPRWSPDGRWIAFVSKRVEDPDRVFFDDIFIIPAEGGRERRLTASAGPVMSLAWSPDGRRLAFFGKDLSRGYNSNAEVWTVSVEGGDARSHTRSLDRSVGDQLLSDGRLLPGDPGPIWWDERTILFLCSDRGRTHLYRVTLDDEVRPLVEGDFRLYTFHARRSVPYFVLGRSSPTHPGELFLWQEGEWTPITHCNEAFVAEHALVTPEFFRVSSPGGVQVDAWLMKPPDFEEGRMYPLILYIHGGPHLAYGWSWFHEFQYLASAGYCVLYTNPRGSQSYGEAFNDAISKNWGPPVQEDVEAALDAVLARGFVDPQRVGVTGGSFGGYMTNWIIGHSDRYAAAVTQRCCSNLINLVGNDDVGHYFCEQEAPGCPWDHWEWYIENSPLAYVHEMRTPLLIIHSDQDHRCPLDQAEQLYRALRLLRRDVAFVVFLGASHGLSRTGKPAQRVERLKRIRGWFDEKMGGVTSDE